MEGLTIWLGANSHWVFSGIGVLALSIIFNLFRKARRGKTQTIKSGDNSSNYQAGRDLVVGPVENGKDGKQG